MSTWHSPLPPFFMFIFPFSFSIFNVGFYLAVALSEPSKGFYSEPLQVLRPHYHRRLGTPTYMSLTCKFPIDSPVHNRG